MSPYRWLPALCLSLPGCFSTTPRAVPAKIDPPPVVLTMPWPTSVDLVEGANAQQPAVWSVEWISAYGCERAKRAGLVEAWPR